MLDFGSGYDDILLRSNRRDAHETIQFGAIGIHLTAPRIDHHWMKAFSNYGVHNAFGVEAMEEQEVMPGVIMSKPVGGWGCVPCCIAVWLYAVSCCCRL